MITIAVIRNYNKMPLKAQMLFTDTCFPNSRVVAYYDPSNFIHQLEALVTKVPEDFFEAVRFRAEHREDGTIIKRDINGTTYFGDTMCTWHIRLVEVDNSRPWTIDNHDEYDEEEEGLVESYESITYLDYDIKNSSLNYAVRRKDNYGVD
jgi:hypothetical protein